VLTAVIGHGRSPEGRGWAPRIDACDVVVRMWDWHWQSADYGTKYDYGLFEVHWTILQNFQAHNQRTPAMGWIASDIRILEERGQPLNAEKRDRPQRARPRPKHFSIRNSRLYARAQLVPMPAPLPVEPKAELPSNTEVIDQRVWTARYPEIGGVGETGSWELTRGAFAACWAVSRSKPGDTVVLVGCDNMYAGITAPMDQAFCPAYRVAASTFKIHSYRAGLTKSGNHDFPAERRLIERMASIVSVDVFFAQERW
jgi:hypothetical protein